MERQSFACNCLYVVRLDDFAGLVLDSDLRTVQVGNLEVNTCQSLKECYFLLDQEVSSFALELLVRLFLNNNHNITWFHAWVLISLAVEDILLVVRGTFVDFCLNYLFLLDDLFTIASLAFVLFINYLALTIAFITGA